MHPFYTDYLARLEKMHTGIHKELDAFPPDALDWLPNQEMNSVTVLVIHLTGAERYWIGDVVMDESSGRDRDAEFLQTGWDHESLRRRLDDNLAYARQALARLGPQDLELVCVSPRDGTSLRAAEALLHALDHTALHLGHIQITRQLWEAKIQ